MTRLIAIVIFIVVAVLLLRYNTNQKLQTGLAYGLLAVFLVYAGYMVLSELLR